jgi:hypothetical protein
VFRSSRRSQLIGHAEQRWKRAQSRGSLQEDTMAKGQEAPKKNNKPKLSVKEKKAKKKEKASK